MEMIAVMTFVLFGCSFVGVPWTWLHRDSFPSVGTDRLIEPTCAVKPFCTFGNRQLSQPGPIRRLSFSPNGRWLVSGAADCSICIWEVETARRAARIENAHRAPIESLCWSADSRYIASSGWDKRVRLWSFPDAKQMLDLETDDVGPVAIDSSRKLLAFGGQSGVIRVWSVPSGTEVAGPPPRKGTVESLAFTSNAKLVIGSSLGALGVWDVASGQEYKLENPDPGQAVINGVATNTDESFSITQGKGGQSWLNIWDIRRGHLERRVLLAKASTCVRFAVSPDGRLFAAVHVPERAEISELRIEVWGRLINSAIMTLDGLGDINCIALSPCESTLAIARHNTIELRQAKSGRLLFNHVGHVATVNSVAFSADGKALASSDDEGHVCIWDLTKRISQCNLRGPLGWRGSCVSFAMKRNAIIAAGSDRCLFWDLDSGSLVRSERTIWDFRSLAVSGDGKYLAAGVRKTGGFAISGDGEGPGTLCVAKLDGDNQWDVCRTGLDDINAVAISPDGRTLVAAGQVYLDRGAGVLYFFDLGTRKLLRKKVCLTGPIETIAFSPDGLSLAVGGSFDHERDLRVGPRSRSSKAFLSIWNLAAGKPVLELKGHERMVDSVSFSPNGRLLASGGEDTTVRVWDAKSGKQLAKLVAHEGPVRTVAFSPDGKLLASAGNDTMIVLWNVMYPRE